MTCCACRALEGTTAPSLLSGQVLDETWPVSPTVLDRLEAVNDVPKKDGPVGLALLGGPPLNAVSFDRLLLKGA